MTGQQWPFKRCSGAHCHKREECVHHALPTTMHPGMLVHPAATGDDCLWFYPKDGWGAGPDTTETD